MLLDQVVSGLIMCVILQILLGLGRMGLVHACNALFTPFTCYLFTFQSQSSILWYLFLNILSFHIVRLVLANKLSCGIATFLFVHNLYVGMILYYVLDMLDFAFV